MVVVVVTDSSACLPTELRDRWGIRQVPLHILLDDTDLLDGVDQIPYDIYQRERVTTAGATPDELRAVYQRALADSDGDGVVGVHISSAMGIGFVALAAAQAAADGAGLDAVVAGAASAVRRGHAYIVVHRLDNLRRSGRIGSSAAWLRTALSLKPLLCIDDGKLVLAQRIRTVGKAVGSMIDRVCEVVGDRPAAIAVHHVANPEGAAEVAAALAVQLPACAPAIVTDLGPVLALHVGAGAVAVCVDVPDDE